MPARSERLKVLLLGSPGAECTLLLQQALAPHVDLVSATSLAECHRLLEREQAPGFDVLLCEWCYEGGSWRDALESIRARVPELPVIVACRTGGEAEWMEVLAAGAFDMLTAPFSTDQVLFALTNAAAARQERFAAKVPQCA